MRYPQGQPVQVKTTVRDVSGALVSAGTLTLVVKVAAADGTLTTTGTYSSPVNDGLGLYHQDIPAADLTTLGHYKYVWTAAGTGAGISRGTFDVYDPFEDTALSLQDAKDHLNIAQTVTTYDAEIQQWIDTIETSMEGMTGGPLTNRSVTERAEFTPDLIMLGPLLQRPVVSVTQIVSIPNGSAVDISSGLDIDNLASVVYMKGGWAFPAFSPLATVTYVAGWGVQLPAAFNDAERIILRHFWDTQHGPSARPSMGGEEIVTLPGWGFAIPARAVELLTGTLNGLPFMPEVFA